MDLKLVSDRDDIVTVSVSGDISLSGKETVEPLMDLLGEELYAKQLLLDARMADRIDSSGIGWLVTCQNRFAKAGGRMVIHSVQPFVSNVLKVVRLDSFFQLALNEQRGILLLKEET